MGNGQATPKAKSTDKKEITEGQLFEVMGWCRVDGTSEIPSCWNTFLGISAPTGVEMKLVILYSITKNAMTHGTMLDMA